MTNTDTSITVSIKSIYGVDKIYPACPKAEVFCKLLNQKTAHRPRHRPHQEAGHRRERWRTAARPRCRGAGMEKIPTEWNADPYGDHWSFAYVTERGERDDYDFRIEFNEAVDEAEELAVVHLIESTPKLLAALKDLLGDRPAVQGGVCRHCGRDYTGKDTPEGDCPSDDCPSFKAKAAIADAEGRAV